MVRDVVVSVVQLLALLVATNRTESEARAGHGNLISSGMELHCSVTYILCDSVPVAGTVDICTLGSVC